MKDRWVNMGYGDTPASPSGSGSHANCGASSIAEGPLQPYVDTSLDEHSTDERRLELLERLGFARDAVLKSLTDAKYDAPHAAYMLLAFKLVRASLQSRAHISHARRLFTYVYEYDIYTAPISILFIVRQSADFRDCIPSTRAHAHATHTHTHIYAYVHRRVDKCRAAARRAAALRKSRSRWASRCRRVFPSSI